MRIVVGLTVSVLVVGASVACDKGDDEATDPKPAVTASRHDVVRLTPESVAGAGIEVQPVSRGEFRLHRDFPGTVQPNENELAEITALVRGRVVDVFVDMGQDVKAGMPLAQLDSSELGLAQASHLKASARLHESELAFERAQDLFQHKAISQAEFQKREADVKSVRAEAREARSRLEVLGMRPDEIQRLDREQTIRSSVPIRAPFEGRVIMRNITRGEVLEISHKMFSIADLSDVWVMANIPEKDVRFVHPRQTVEVRATAYPHEVFHGTITYIGDVLDPATRTMKLRVVVPNPDRRLKPEMFAAVRLYTQTESGVLALPIAAVQRVQNQPVVFVRLDDRSFEARSVKLGDESGDVVKLLDGLREGEPIVTKGSFTLKSELVKHQLEPAR
jgi:cobalt-zinc-cadmium efflux system membrane fusion protein